MLKFIEGFLQHRQESIVLHALGIRSQSKPKEGNNYINQITKILNMFFW